MRQSDARESCCQFITAKQRDTGMKHLKLLEDGSICDLKLWGEAGVGGGEGGCHPESIHHPKKQLCQATNETKQWFSFSLLRIDGRFSGDDGRFEADGGFFFCLFFLKIRFQYQTQSPVLLFWRWFIFKLFCYRCNSSLSHLLPKNC